MLMNIKYETSWNDRSHQNTSMDSTEADGGDDGGGSSIVVSYVVVVGRWQRMIVLKLEDPADHA